MVNKRDYEGQKALDGWIPFVLNFIPIFIIRNDNELDTHPIFKKKSESELIQENNYWNLSQTRLVKTPICFKSDWH